jgi:hypothetical protein
MEEDIKILEDFIKYYEAECTSRGFERTLIVRVDKDDVQSLENLIKEYRELEERNIYLVNERKKLEELLFMSNENYIEKSKVKEKIEEYEKMKKATYTDLTHYGDLRRDTVLEVSQVLQELLGDEE